MLGYPSQASGSTQQDWDTLIHADDCVANYEA